jgi:predicted alpha/beta superfamily hydrolase
MRLATALFLTIVLAFPARAQRRFERATNIGQLDSIRSATLNEVRPFLVYTPPSYSDSTVVPARYPVLYLLDGFEHFHAVSGLIQALGTGVNGTFAIPEMIVVAIPNVGASRERDLTPTHATRGADGAELPDQSESGGGPAFLDFIRNELIPHIDAAYRTIPYRVFVGHSLGGITTLNALYTMPETFSAYVAIDPSLWWDKRVLLKKAKGFFETAHLDGKALWVAQANTITPGDTARNVHFESITAFDAVMKTFDRSGIRYGYRYYPQDSHGSVPLIAEYDALRFIFEAWDIPMQRILGDPSLLAEHFRSVSETLGATFEPSDGLLRLLSQAAPYVDSTKAVTFAEMRVARFPDHPRPYEALGDFWAAKGDAAKARGYYEQALARNGYPTRINRKIGRLAR